MPRKRWELLRIPSNNHLLSTHFHWSPVQGHHFHVVCDDVNKTHCLESELLDTPNNNHPLSTHSHWSPVQRRHFRVVYNDINKTHRLKSDGRTLLRSPDKTQLTDQENESSALSSLAFPRMFLIHVIKIRASPRQSTRRRIPEVDLRQWK